MARLVPQRHNKICIFMLTMRSHMTVVVLPLNPTHFANSLVTVPIGTDKLSGSSDSLLEACAKC